MDRVSGLTIGEVAHRSGVAPSAIRYYESLGLIPAPPRLHGERRYPDDVYATLGFIAVAQAAGFTLREIRVLTAHASPDADLASAMQAMASQKLVEVESTLARATAMKQWLEVARSCGCADPAECNLFLADTELAAGRTELPVVAGEAGCRRDAPV
jgi:MerR family transcriptional regulator, redox-sensitive transcriptional activator SoxR